MITDYLFEITTLAGVVGGVIYFIFKEYWKYRIRKSEAMFSSKFQTKISELKELLDIVVSLENSLRSLDSTLMFSKGERYYERLDPVLDLWNRYRVQSTYLNLLLTEQEKQPLKKIERLLKDYHQYLDFRKIDMEDNTVDRDQVIKLRALRKRITEELPTLYEEIEVSFKTSN